MTENAASEEEMRAFVRDLFTPDPDEDGRGFLAPKTTDNNSKENS